MRIWERARLAESCGSCNVRLKPDTSILVVTLPQLGPLQPRRIRCAACAGEAPDQAQLDVFDEQAERAAIVSDGAPTPYLQRRVTTPLPFDAKAAAAGEENP